MSNILLTFKLLQFYIKMKKRTFTIAFKMQVITFMEKGNSFCKAKKYFDQRDNEDYDQSMFCKWYKIREKIKLVSSAMKRTNAAGGQTCLSNLEFLKFVFLIYFFY